MSLAESIGRSPAGVNLSASEFPEAALCESPINLAIAQQLSEGVGREDGDRFYPFEH
jgi:hypothetical protein